MVDGGDRGVSGDGESWPSFKITHTTPKKRNNKLDDNNSDNHHHAKKEDKTGIYVCMPTVTTRSLLFIYFFWV